MKLLNKLYNLNRSLLSDDNHIALEYINSEIPLTIHKYKSGEKCFDWTIPKKWKVNRGTLKDSNGNIVIDCYNNILHLINYSTSFSGKILKNDLINYLHYDKDLPDAIPYRTSYYNDNWGFCLTYNQFQQLTDDVYYIDIDTEFEDDHLLIGEATIKGSSKQEVVLTSYYCHPNQINDGLSGVILLIELYNKLKTLNLKYTYKFFFWPETIGCLTALSNNLINPNCTEYALVATTVGKGDAHYKKTYLDNHSIDNIILELVGNKKKYQPTGSDERQLSSQSIRIPTGVLTTIPYEQFPEYHTSADDLNFVSMDTINNMVELYLKILLTYESYDKYKMLIGGGEPFLSKYNLYRSIGTPGNSKHEIIRNWILHYCDGTKNIKDISKLLDLPEQDIAEYILQYEKNQIIRKV